MSGMFSSIEGPGIIYEKLHRPLARAQGTPLIGPAIVSPIHLVVSAIQLAVGLVFAILSAIAALFCLTCSEEGKSFFGKKAAEYTLHAGSGLAGIGWSIANMLTIGGLAIKVMGTPCQPKA